MKKIHYTRIKQPSPVFFIVNYSNFVTYCDFFFIKEREKTSLFQIGKSTPCGIGNFENLEQRFQYGAGSRKGQNAFKWIKFIRQLREQNVVRRSLEHKITKCIK